MSLLFLRLVQLREEYFNEFSDEDLSRLTAQLESVEWGDGEYTSGKLIEVMKEYSDLFNLRRQ